MGQLLLIAYLADEQHLLLGYYHIESGNVVSIFPTRQLNLCEPGCPVINTPSPVVVEAVPEAGSNC